MVEVTVSHFC